MIKVLGDRVLVLLEASPPEIVTESGILLKRDPDYRKVPTRGIVAQLGEKRRVVELDQVVAIVKDCCAVKVLSREALHDILPELEGLQPAPFDVAVGDCVIFAPGDGEEVELDGSSYVILREAEILGVVEAMELQVVRPFQPIAGPNDEASRLPPQRTDQQNAALTRAEEV